MPAVQFDCAELGQANQRCGDSRFPERRFKEKHHDKETHGEDGDIQRHVVYRGVNDRGFDAKHLVVLLYAHFAAVDRFMPIRFGDLPRDPRGDQVLEGSDKHELSKYC
jgi:hypothetical protein